MRLGIYDTGAAVRELKAGRLIRDLRDPNRNFRGYVNQIQVPIFLPCTVFRKRGGINKEEDQKKLTRKSLVPAKQRFLFELYIFLHYADKYASRLQEKNPCIMHLVHVKETSVDEINPVVVDTTASLINRSRFCHEVFLFFFVA